MTKSGTSQAKRRVRLAKWSIATKRVLLRLGQTNQPPRDNLSSLAISILPGHDTTNYSSSHSVASQSEHQVMKPKHHYISRISLGALDGAFHLEGGDEWQPKAGGPIMALPTCQLIKEQQISFRAQDVGSRAWVHDTVPRRVWRVETMPVHLNGCPQKEEAN